MLSETVATAARVLFGAPRKSGNARLRCLLASAYELQIVSPRDVPTGQDPTVFSQWLDEFPRQSVAGTSGPCSPELKMAATRNGIILVGVLRHPFDLFVSNYDIAQQRGARERNSPEDTVFWGQFAGHALDDPEMLDYAVHGFAEEIAWLNGWQEGAAATVRYERLEADPAEALKDLAPALGGRSMDVIAHAVALCPSESHAVSRPVRGRRMGTLASGSWRERLPQTLQETLRARYAPDVERLGYEVV
jgi:hypothetical protein